MEQAAAYLAIKLDLELSCYISQTIGAVFISRFIGTTLETLNFEARLKKKKREKEKIIKIIILIKISTDEKCDNKLKKKKKL